MEEIHKTDILQIDETVRAHQLERLARVKSTRDNGAVANSLEKLKLAARDNENTMSAIIEAVAAAKTRAHSVAVSGDMALVALADGAALEQALGHLVQNAIDASEAGVPVELRVFESGGDVAIEVIDRGQGMSGEFVRSRLFQPFASTKEAGFGIGAYEARTLIRAMGGRLEVESAEGEGTCFTIFLPGAATRSQINVERMRA